ncbi:MAG: alpha/beta hydrolase [Acidobacteriota bacterium]
MSAQRPAHRVEHGMFVREYSPQGAPETVLWVHGLGESGLCFERIAAHEKLREWRHLIPDLPSYGRSAWTDEPLSLTEQSDRLREWLETRHAGQVVVLGHSMGGVLALLFAERHRSLVRAVIDVDGNKSRHDCSFSGQAVRYSVEDFVRSGFDALRDLVYRQGERDAAHRGYYASLRLCDPRAYLANSLELIALSSAEDMARRLAALDLPVLYVAGAPGGASARTRKLLAESRVPCVEIAPSGHWPFIDQPDRFADAIRRFLADLESTSARSGGTR